MAPDISLEVYRALMEEKRRLLTEYKEATLRMKNSLEQQNHSLLNVCIVERQLVIERIEGIDRKLQREPPHGPGNQQGPAGKEVKKLLTETQSLLYSISKLEKECVDLAKAEQDQIKNEILSLRNKRRGASGYRAAGSSQARFVDTVK